MLDWRALRPGKDHFAYTISKAALAAMTKSMALALAPEITVNGLALGAILPPAEENKPPADPEGANVQPSSQKSVLKSIINPVPAARWADIKEVTDTVSFLLSGPAYITGEIIHIDGGRHLV
jgi:pteridine reductase